jgi:hypothetical protein
MARARVARQDDRMTRFERIAIIGNAAGGKSTLARQLAARFELPYVEVDSIQWGPSWELVPEGIVRAELARAQQDPRWVIDGFGPWPVIEARFSRADAIVFVDLPLWMHYEWAANRQLALMTGAARGFGERDAPPTGALFETMWRVHTDFRPRLLELVEAHRKHAQVFHITTPDELEAFAAQLELAPPERLAPARSPSVSLRLDAETAIDLLGLEPHPEGGWFAETWRDRDPSGGRGSGTAIYYLLRRGERSHWHRIDAVEIWHFYAGASLELSIAERDDTTPVRVRLGRDLLAGERPQAIVPAGAWQSARADGEWSLVGCTVSPGFEMEAFELAPSGWKPGTAVAASESNDRE